MMFSGDGDSRMLPGLAPSNLAIHQELGAVTINLHSCSLRFGCFFNVFFYVCVYVIIDRVPTYLLGADADSVTPPPSGDQCCCHYLHVGVRGRCT